MDIKPGLTVNFIINIDYRKEIVETKNTIIHDIIENRIIAAQPDPPISRAHIKEEIYVTFLEKEQGKVVRFGFPAKIVDFIKDYELTTQLKTQAIELRKEGEPEPYNLRMFYRLEPPDNCGIDIFIDGNKMTILDISIGGASFSHNRTHRFKEKEEEKIILVVGEKIYQIDSRVIRVQLPEIERMKKSIEFVSIQFLNVDGLIKNELGRKIRDIERELRYKEIGQ